jgi:hypothetical protein
MTWPPAELPIDFENATPQENTHPDAHNATNQTINADLVPEIKRVGALAETIGLYLPLTGGTLTGDLAIDGSIQARSGGNASSPAYGFGTGDYGLGMYSQVAEQWLRFAVAGVQRMQINTERVIVNDDLRVDGNIQAMAGGSGSNIAYGFEGDTEGLGIYSNIANQWLRFAAGGAQRMQVNPDRVVVNNDLKVDGVIIGNLSFGIADGIDTADILNRAETATTPVLDDDATDDLGAMVTVNEVVTALLATVKQLTARVEELE